MRVYFGLFALVLFAVAACSSSDIPTSRATGIFNVQDTSDGHGGYVVKPTAVFWDASNTPLPYSTQAPDSCINTAYYPSVPTTTPLQKQLDAGSPLQFQTDLAVGTMTPDTIPQVLITYRYHGAGVPHTPGADIVFTVPGASPGFPAGSEHMVTAKKLLLGPIATAPPDSLHLTWTIGQPDVAAVNFNLIYASQNATLPDSQIVCSLIDDGDYWVNKKTAAPWRAAATTYQQVSAFRWITTYFSGADASLWLLISAFDTTKATLP